MRTAVCERDCYFQHHLWRKGDTYQMSDDQVVAPKGKQLEEHEIPYHFRELNPGETVPAPEPRIPPPPEKRGRGRPKDLLT